MKDIVSIRHLGVSFHQGTANVQVWAPNSGSVELVLEGNERIGMQQAERGYWNVTTDQLRPGGRYWFSLDGQDPVPDPASLSQPDGVHKSSQAIDTGSFSWNDEQWGNMSLADYIIYELHTGTFTPSGDFRGMEDKLDYLIGLGVTAIEIMPVSQFPGARNWGYDGVFPFATQSSYGGAEGLSRLVNACHSKGLAVILDVVYNHMGPEGNYLQQYGPYFTDKYKTPWGSAINFDDAGSDEVRRYVIENALMWFRDFHIDALRLDAVHAIRDFGPKHILQELKEHVDQLQQATGRKHHLIVECDLNDTKFINELSKGGYGMDAQWMDEFHHALRVSSGNERNGYFADFDGLEHLAKSYMDAYVYDGQYSEHRQKNFGVKSSNRGSQFVVFSQNHDQVGNRMLGERSVHLVGPEMAKLMAAAVFISPFIPLMFMGEEYAETNPFQYFVSHSDPELSEAVRKGRKAEFEAFHSGEEAPDPNATETFENSKLQWELLEKEAHKKMLAYYKALIALKKNEPALHSDDRNSISVTLEKEKQLLQVVRTSQESKLCCVLNFSEAAGNVPFPHGGNWSKIFDSADEQWGGPGASTSSAASLITAGPRSIVIYKI